MDKKEGNFNCGDDTGVDEEGGVVSGDKYPDKGMCIHMAHLQV